MNPICWRKIPVTQSAVHKRLLGVAQQVSAYAKLCW